MIEPKLNVEALRNVIKALRESPDPTSFSMTSYATDCGTPACCLGHYAARSDLQNIFEVSKVYGLKLVGSPEWVNGGRYVEFDDGPVLEHFGIDINEAYALFSATGCNYASTTEAAAQFIENFIKEKESA